MSTDDRGTEMLMLTYAQVFSISNLVAMLCWIALGLSLFLPVGRAWIQRITGLIVPGLFAVVYLVCICYGFAESPGGGFGSLTQVRALFANDAALDAGWLHYLAFDLFVGTWIVRQGTLERMQPLLLLLCLPVTFMLGPIGLLLFLIERAVFSKKSGEGVAA